jgi:hypothetical protein
MRLGRLYRELLNGVKEQIELNQILEERHLNYSCKYDYFCVEVWIEDFELVVAVIRYSDANIYDNVSDYLESLLNKEVKL